MITIYSDASCPFSHITRIVVNYKQMDVKLIYTDLNSFDKDLMLISQHNEVPILVDDVDRNNKKKNLVLTTTPIICEYIDERFPHPQLMPIEPVEKARLRMMILQMNKELLSEVKFLHNNLTNKDIKIKKELDKAKNKIIEMLDNLANVFAINKTAEFLFGNSFTLLDANLLPLLWRLSYYDIKIKDTWGGLLRYSEKMFATQEFMNSLTPTERGMRTN
jgi:RNA polymerase-associated protein